MNGRTDNATTAARNDVARRAELIGLVAAALETALKLPEAARVGSANPRPADAMRDSLTQYGVGTVEWEVGPRGRSMTVGLAVSVGGGGLGATAIATAVRVGGSVVPATAMQAAIVIELVAGLAAVLERL